MFVAHCHLIHTRQSHHWQWIYGLSSWQCVQLIMKMYSFTSNVTGRHRGQKRKLRAGHRVPSIKCTSCCDAFSSSSVVLMLSLRYACIWHSGIILTPRLPLCPNFVSFTTSTAELARGEKLCTESLTHSLTKLIWCYRNRSFHFGISVFVHIKCLWNRRHCNIDLEDLKSSNVQYANKWRALAFSAIDRTIDSLDNPLEHALIDCFADCLHSKLHLKQANITANFVSHANCR